MKKICVLAMVGMISMSSFAQDLGTKDQDIKKPGLFRQLPDTIPVDIASLNALLSLGAGSEVEMEISRVKTLPLKGTVISSSEKYNGRIHSVSVQSPAFEGAVFHLTKSVIDDGQEQFRATWIHKDYADIYTLTHNVNGYVLLKKRFRDLILE